MNQGNLVVQNDLTNKGVLTKENINALATAGIIPKNTPIPQIQIFAQICNEKGLSPFSKEVYLVGYGGNYSVIVGINGFRKIAAETGVYAGCSDVKFDIQSNGSFKTAEMLLKENKLPKTATVTAYRIVAGLKAEFTHTVVFSEFSSGKQKWKTMPFQMIAKVAEAFALRKGFSDRLTGLNVIEESAVMSNDIKGEIPDLISVADLKEQIQAIDTIEGLSQFYASNPSLHTNQEFLDMMTDRKGEINRELV